MAALQVLWLTVFAVDASLTGRGRSHQLGALALGLLFATLVIGELRSSRRHDQGSLRARPDRR